MLLRGRSTAEAREVVEERSGIATGGRIDAVRILSIQSSVAYGHVGNSAAVFPLQRLGHEVMPVFTVQFSNHTGYGAHRGVVLDPGDVHEVILGIEERGGLSGVDLVLTGYLGSPAIVEVVRDAVQRTRRASPSVGYACDPVIGNARRGTYVDAMIPAAIADRLLGCANLITPNQFELGALAGADPAGAPTTLDAIVATAHGLRDRGPEVVLVTSIEYVDQRPGTTGMVVVTGAGSWLVLTPRLAMTANGSGDVTAALFAAHLTAGLTPADALGRTAASVHDLLRATLSAGSSELLIVESQDAYVDPRTEVNVERLA